MFLTLEPVVPWIRILPGTTSAGQGPLLLSSATAVFHFCAWKLSDLIAQGHNLPETDDPPICL